MLYKKTEKAGIVARDMQLWEIPAARGANPARKVRPVNKTRYTMRTTIQRPEHRIPIANTARYLLLLFILSTATLLTVIPR